MPDGESRRIDRKILRFIDEHRMTEASDAAFQALALEIFEYQFRRNTYYRKFCLLEKKDPCAVKNWKEIPAMPALAFKELVLTSFPARTRVRVFRTSGMTREIKGAHFFDTLRLYEASILPSFERYLLPDLPAGALMTGGADLSYYFLISPSKEAPHSSLSYMMEVVNRHFASGRGKYYVKKGAPLFDKLASDLKKEKKQIFLLATAFALKGFLDFLAARKIKLRLTPGSRIMETGGMKGRTKEISKNALYAQCAGRLGVPRTRCVSEYGMTELSSQMYSVAMRPFSGPAWLRTLVIDPRTGKEAKKSAVGLLRHLDLANRGSVMAVQTEDLGRVAGCGLELLGRAKGSSLRGCSLSYEEFIRRGV